jgi:hypothetical protein
MSATKQDTENCGLFAAVMRRRWTKNTAKLAAAVADTSHRTVEGWLTGRGSPSIETVFKMIERDAHLRAELARELAALNERLHQGDDNANHVLAGRRDASRAVTSGHVDRSAVCLAR